MIFACKFMHYEALKARVPYYDSLSCIDYTAECMPEIHGPPGPEMDDRFEFVRYFEKIVWFWFVDLWSMLEILSPI